MRTTKSPLQLTRRMFLGGLAAFAAGLRLPSLSGALAAPLTRVTDFGGLISRQIAGFIDTTDDAIRLIRKGEVVHPRGTGHSCMGMGLKNGSWSFTPPAHALSFSGHDEMLYASASTTLLEADQYLQEYGYMLPVSPDYRFLSLGGVLSVGGYGVESVRNGALIKHVEGLDILRKDGTLARNVSRNNAIYHQVLGGLGRYGTILSLRIKCVRKPRGYYIRRIEYNNFDRYVRDLVSSEPSDDRHDIHYSFWLPDGEGKSGSGAITTGYEVHELPKDVPDGFSYVEDIRALRHDMVSRWVYKPNNSYYVWSDHFIRRNDFSRQAGHTLSLLHDLKKLKSDCTLYSCRLHPSVIGQSQEGLSIGVYANFQKENKPDAYEAALLQLTHSAQAQENGAIPYKYGWFRNLD